MTMRITLSSSSMIRTIKMIRTRIRMILIRTVMIRIILDGYDQEDEEDYLLFKVDGPTVVLIHLPEHVRTVVTLHFVDDGGGRVAW